MSETAYEPSQRTVLRRMAGRGTYDRDLVHSVLDEGLVAHVGVATEVGPRVIPLAYARVGETVYLHGSVANHLLPRASGDAELCFVVTLLDGLVLARSAFHHSMNYRSVVVYGTAVPVTDQAEKRTALEALVERAARGRSALVRPPTETELRATCVLALALDEVSAKVRTGDPVDDESDRDRPVWAGVVPLGIVARDPVPAADLALHLR